VSKLTERAATHAWAQVEADETGDAIVAAMALGGVDRIFFSSGSEIVFYQEAIAKAEALGRPAPQMITMTHEHAGLNAALGYSAVSGKPTVTAVHVDAGTLNAGGAIHTAWRSGLPVMMTAGAPPVSYPGSMLGSRDVGGHIWMQQTFDQNSIVRQYTKWDHRLEYQDNAGLIVSRGLQLALSEPRGPVYLSIPREIAHLPLDGASFPTASQLGITAPVAPDPDRIAQIARRLVDARNPFVVVSNSGRNPAAFDALVSLCELLGIAAISSILKTSLPFPKYHTLYRRNGGLADADVVLVLEANVPWMPGGDEPTRDAYVAVIDVDPVQSRIPTFEFTADLRMQADSLLSIEALARAAEGILTATDRSRIAERCERWATASATQQREREERALARATATPIDPMWLPYQLAKAIPDDALVFDEASRNMEPFLRSPQAGTYFASGGSSGGWSPGAAFGAKLAAPERDVIAATGDGFYMYAAAPSALWAAGHYGAPFMAVVYQNRSYRTGTVNLRNVYKNGGYAERGGFNGGTFDPPIDFAKEAEAAGAYGENVRDPAEIAPALARGLAQIRRGTPAVISVWLPRLVLGD
jgi:acetolactate synthase I/II/III large subunit